MSKHSESVELVEQVLARMEVRYGVLWARMWEGVPPEAVKADWVEQLHGLPPYAVHYGLRFLPLDRPPTVAAFKAICSRAPPPNNARLPAPGSSVPSAVKNWKPSFGADPLAGARHLRQREEQGERLTPAQKEFWRTALAHVLAAERAAQAVTA